MKFVNLTPHDINLLTGGKEIVIPASGKIARIESEFTGHGLIQDRHDLSIIDLPEPQNGVFYITSSVVMSEACNILKRTDVISPGGDRRNKQGRINGTTFFQRKVQDAII